MGPSDEQGQDVQALPVLDHRTQVHVVRAMSDHEYRIKDRETKVRKRKGAMPVHGIALKRLLIERATKEQRKVLRHQANRSQWWNG